MRWPRGPRGAWRLLPRRSLLAALFLFSLSSSFLYFVYVAPGIGKRWAEARGAGWGARRLPVETLSNPGRAGPGGAAASLVARCPERGGPGPAAPRCSRRWAACPRLPPALGRARSRGREAFRGGVCVCVCVWGGCPLVSLGASTRGGAGPRCVGGAAGGAGRAPRGASRGWRGPSGAAARAERGGSEPAACLPACRRVCLEEVECCPSVCGLNSLSGRNPTPFVKWEDEKCVF